MSQPKAPGLCLAVAVSVMAGAGLAAIAAIFLPDLPSWLWPVVTGVVCAALGAGMLRRLVSAQVDKPLSDFASLAGPILAGLDRNSGKKTPENTPEDPMFLLGAVVGGLEQERDRAADCARESQAQSRRADLAEAQAERSERSDKVRREGMVSAASTLEEVSRNLKQAAGSLSEEVHQVDEGAVFQRDQMNQTSLAMEDMAKAVTEVSENAGRTSTKADETRECAGRGAEVVARAMQAIDSVHQRTSALKERITGLGDRAESIGRVMGVISDIADQTNLLALNAAIEAARAGDAGRGFAVVADEVRKLAEKTMQATGEVGDVVRAIQSEILAGVEEMESASEAVAEASQLGAQSGESLREIVTLVDDTTDQVRAIATSAEEQSTVGGQVRRQVVQVRDVSDRTAVGMERASRAVERLTEQVEELVKLSGVFRLIGEGKAQELVESLAADEGVKSMDRGRMEPVMRRAVDENPFFELVYATNQRGVQVTENVAGKDFRAAYAESARGRDWSSRPWFRGAVKNKGVYVSPIYQSEASNDYCLTISVPLWGRGGTSDLLGVLAADIRLFG